jgi:hypothetical protein
MKESITTGTNRFFIIDSGMKMLPISESIEEGMRKQGFHFICYLTSQDHYLAVEEITEDEFLDHYKKSETI